MKTKLLLIAIEDSINKWVYLAQIAGLHYSFYISSRGVELVLSGISLKLVHLARKIISELLDVKALSKDRFGFYVETYLKTLLATLIEMPISHGTSKLTVFGILFVLIFHLFQGDND